MARCKECIHGECCSVFIPVRTTLCNDNADEMCKLFKPTADVVPKSEVEALQEALSKAEADVKNYMKVAEYQQNLSVKRYYEIKRLKEDVERLEEINNRDVENLRLAKQEVAREIFEEIERFLYLHFRFCKEEIGNDDTEYVKGRLELNTQIQNFIAELKKKYTEGIDGTGQSKDN